MDAQERAIQTAGWITTVLLAAAVMAGYNLLPALIDFPTDLTERLAFAVKACVFPFFWVLVGVTLVSTGRRRSPEDIGGSAAGPPSDKIAIPAAFLQNTLEQAALAAVAYLALAVLLKGPWLSLIVVGVIFFCVGRVLFLKGYRRGARGRALGMTLTMLPAAAAYPLVLVLIAYGALT